MKIDLNDEAFVNSLICNGWHYCFNAACPRTPECIRFISSKFKPDGVTSGNAIYPDACLHGPCPHFMRVIEFKAAWGLSHIYDDVKHREARTIKFKLMDAMGSRTSYYRVNRGEKHLSTGEQEAVAKIFSDYGYEAPTYDHYAMEIGFAFE